MSLILREPINNLARPGGCYERRYRVAGKIEDQLTKRKPLWMAVRSRGLLCREKGIRRSMRERGLLRIGLHPLPNNLGGS